MAILKFQFDESYNSGAMCVGGWLADELEWKRFERSWQRKIAYFNSRNAPDQQIERYHAARLNARDHEFSNWTQHMSIAFSKRLFSTIQKRKMGAICMCTDLEALIATFPGGDPQDRWSRGYVMCIKQLMVEIGHEMKENYPNDRVLLVHDSGAWDTEALEAYKCMVNDERWQSRRFFVGIKAMNWKESIGLQPADMIAYETFKFVNDTVMPNTEKLRNALSAVFDRHLKFNAKYINQKALIALRQRVEAGT